MALAYSQRSGSEASRAIIRIASSFPWSRRARAVLMAAWKPRRERT